MIPERFPLFLLVYFSFPFSFLIPFIGGGFKVCLRGSTKFLVGHEGKYNKKNKGPTLFFTG